MRKINESTNPLLWVEDDGGRADSGRGGGWTRDCVVRAISLATEIPYDKVYRDIFDMAKNWVSLTDKVDATDRWIRNSPSPSKGVHNRQYAKYMRDLGWEATFGKTRMNDAGIVDAERVIVRQTRGHLVAVIEGTLYDAWDSRLSSAGGYHARVDQYWVPPSKSGTRNISE